MKKGSFRRTNERKRFKQKKTKGGTMLNRQFTILLIAMLIIPISIFAESPFPETVIQSKYSTSPYATTENLFSPQNPYGEGQELNGQCTWYVYGRVIELVDNNYIVESVEDAMYNAFNQTYGRHAKNWDTLLAPYDNWFDTNYAYMPNEDRKAGKIVMWDYGNYGHVAFVEEVNSDRSQYKISEFNWAVPEGYTSAVWLPFEGDDQRGTGVYPKFYDLELRPDGYAPVSNGLTISPDPVTLDQDFNISFTLHEINGGSVTFEEIAIAILDANNDYIFDFENWNNVTVSAYGYYSESATGQIWYDNGNNPPGQYKAELRGRVSGGNWFQFDTTGAGVNPVTFNVIAGTEGPDLIVEDIWTDPADPEVGEYVDLYAKIKNIGDETADGIHWSYYIDGTYIDDDSYDELEPGESRTEYENNYVFNNEGNHTYMVSVDQCPNESDTNNNSRSETVNVISGYAPVSNGLTISPDPVTLDQDFDISFTLHEIDGASITFEEIAIAILDANNDYIFDFENWYNVTISANGYYSESATGQIWYDNGNNPPGQYKAELRGRVSGGNWFQFDTTESGVNPVTFTAIMDQDIVVNSLNPPEGPIELNENQSQLFVIDAFDPDGNDLEYSWLLDGTEVSTSDSYNFTTDYSSAGEYELDLYVTDNFGSRSELNFEWEIVVNDVSSVEDNIIPLETKLVGNFPNPFNPTTTIQYALNKSGFVKIEIYNAKGQKLKSLVNQNQTAGNKSVIWNGVNENGDRTGSGLFLYKLVFNGNVLSMKKCIMLK